MHDVTEADLFTAVSDLQRRLHRQTLVLRALFTILRETVGISEEELLQRVLELAPRGGVYAKPPVPQRQPCPKCGSSFGHRRHRCLFCGEKWKVASAFEFLEMAPETDLSALVQMPDGNSESIRPAK